MGGQVFFFSPYSSYRVELNQKELNWRKQAKVGLEHVQQICKCWNWWIMVAEVKGTRESTDPEVIVEFHEPVVQSFQGREMVQNFFL